MKSSPGFEENLLLFVNDGLSCSQARTRPMVLQSQAPLTTGPLLEISSSVKWAV